MVIHRHFSVAIDNALWASRGVGRGRGLGVGLEEMPDAAGEVAFEAADCFPAGLAFGLAAGEVGGAFGVQAALGDGEAV
jgi:hypothetical protein